MQRCSLRLPWSLRNLRPSCLRHFSAVARGEDVKDVVVVGAGVVGSTLAARLEPRSPPSLSAAAQAELPDVRVFAITPASMRTLDACGVAEAMKATGRISSFGEMQVWDALGPAHITFTSQDATDVSAAGDLQAGSATAPLGYIAENGVLNGALFDELQRLHAGGQLELICPAKVKGIDVPGEGSAAQMLPEAAGSQPPASADRLASVTLEDGRVLRTRLLVAADGAASAVRGAAHIGTWGWSYDQHGVVATVRTDGHGDTAWQRFLPHGPVAILPLWDGYASIVWSTTPDHAATLLKLSPPEFAAALNTVLTAPTATFAAALAGDAAPPSGTPSAAGTGEPDAAAAYQATLYNKSRDTLFLDPLWVLHRAGSALVGRLVAQQTAASAAPPLRAPPRITGVVGPRAAFPLRFQSASAYTAPRVALVGDAAHVVHPLAGQGLNLGIGDAQALADALLVAHENGADVGSLHTLREYERRQQPHNLAMMGGVDALRRIFDWQVDGRLLPGSLTAGQKHSLWSPMIVGRNAGLALLNSMPSLKRMLANVAMGA